jgi:uncharacterized protein involved in exopolysaccharide biosynthesis
MKIFSGTRDPAEVLRQSIQADIESDSDILEISIDTPHREDAAKLVNAIVAAQLKRAGAQTSSAAQALAELTKLRQQREADRATAEKALTAFMQANPTFSAAATTRDTGVTERIAQLEQAQAKAQADVAKVKAGVDAANTADPAKMKQLVDAARGNGIFDAVEQQRKDTEAELAQLNALAAKQKATMLPQHPVVLRTQAQIERLKTKLAAMDQEYAKAYRAYLDSQLQTAMKKQTELTALLEEQKKAAGGTDPRSAEHAKLVSALKQATDSLAETDAKLKQAAVPAASSGMRLRVLEPAEPPAAPSRPQKVVVLAGGLIAGLLIGLALASVRSR